MQLYSNLQSGWFKQHRKSEEQEVIIARQQKQIDALPVGLESERAAETKQVCTAKCRE